MRYYIFSSHERVSEMGELRLPRRSRVRVDRLCRPRSPAGGRHGLGMIARERVAANWIEGLTRLICHRCFVVSARAAPRWYGLYYSMTKSLELRVAARVEC
jgi:hypothetical protein